MAQKKRTWRSVFYSLLPGWMTEGEGELVHHSLTRVIDGFLERARQGLQSRFPSYAPDSALALLGKDRSIRRGRSETPAHYAQRLIAWRSGHRRRGGAFALLLQVYHYWGECLAWTVTPKGNRHQVDTDAVETFEYGYAWEWDELDPAANWARFWIVLDATSMPTPLEEHPTLGDPLLWGGLTLGGAVAAGYTVGQQHATPDDTDAMHALCRGRHPWRPAFARPEWLVVSLTGDTPAPDGAWDTHRGRLAASLAGFRFWPLRTFALG